MLNILIPMAGRGSRFASAGFDLPKPLILVHGQVPMIRLVIENLRPRRQDSRFIFLCLAEHLRDHDLENQLRSWAGESAQIVTVEGVTEGAACTALLARDLINSDEPLMIANSDQYVDIDLDKYLESAPGADGLIMTMTASDPKWSFIRLDDNLTVTQVVEKEVISDEATVGIYNFAAGRDFVRAGNAMIARGLRVNGEFYVAPVYNQLIEEGAVVRHFNVGAEANGMYGLGIPADLHAFEDWQGSGPLVHRVVSGPGA